MKAIAFVLIATLAGCANSEVIPQASNKFSVTTSASPLCTQQEASRVAFEVAAVETLRRGHDRFIVTGATSSTTITNADSLIGDSQNAQVTVTILKPADPEYANGLDAKQELGPDWANIVENGVDRC